MYGGCHARRSPLPETGGALAKAKPSGPLNSLIAPVTVLAMVLISVAVLALNSAAYTADLSA